MDAWKKENIQQIKENINLIKQNSENFKLLKEDNEKLEKEVEDLKNEINELTVLQNNANQEYSQITNRLAKYYNQDINYENMTAKVYSLMKRCEETVRKTNETGLKKELLQKEILDLKAKFEDAVSKFKERAEYKNNLLDEHIKQLSDKHAKFEVDVEEIMNAVDQVAGHDTNSPFSREMVNDMLANIRHVLFTKTQVIKNLKYSLALAIKVTELLITFIRLIMIL